MSVLYSKRNSTSSLNSTSTGGLSRSNTICTPRFTIKPPQLCGPNASKASLLLYQSSMERKSYVSTVVPSPTGLQYSLSRQSSVYSSFEQDSQLRHSSSRHSRSSSSNFPSVGHNFSSRNHSANPSRKRHSSVQLNNSSSFLSTVTSAAPSIVSTTVSSTAPSTAPSIVPSAGFSTNPPSKAPHSPSYNKSSSSYRPTSQPLPSRQNSIISNSRRKPPPSMPSGTTVASSHRRLPPESNSSSSYSNMGSNGQSRTQHSSHNPPRHKSKSHTKQGSKDHTRERTEEHAGKRIRSPRQEDHEITPKEILNKDKKSDKDGSKEKERSLSATIHYLKSLLKEIRRNHRGDKEMIGYAKRLVERHESLLHKVKMGSSFRLFKKKVD